jgi:glutathione S-transferase
VITLYDADRCPYCARVRIVLAEKQIPYEVVAVDLTDKPVWLYEKNPLGKVPVLEEDDVCISESAVIMELLDERYPEPALLPADAADRALARVALWQHDALFANAYYAARRGVEGAFDRLASHLVALDEALSSRPYLAGASYGLADIGWFPWLPRAEAYLEIELGAYPAVAAWVDRLAVRPAIAAELEIVAALGV